MKLKRQQTKSLLLLSFLLISLSLLAFLLLNFRKNQAAQQSFAAPKETPPSGVCHTDSSGKPLAWEGPRVDTGNMVFNRLVIHDSSAISQAAPLKIPAAKSLFGAVFLGLSGQYSATSQANSGGLWGDLVLRFAPTTIILPGGGTRSVPGMNTSLYIRNGEPAITNRLWCADQGSPLTPSLEGCRLLVPSKSKTWQYPLDFLPLGDINIPFEFYAQPPQWNGNTNMYMRVENVKPIYLGGCSLPADWTYDPAGGYWRDPTGYKWYWDSQCSNGAGCWLKQAVCGWCGSCRETLSPSEEAGLFCAQVIPPKGQYCAWTGSWTGTKCALASLSTTTATAAKYSVCIRERKCGGAGYSCKGIISGSSQACFAPNGTRCCTSCINGAKRKEGWGTCDAKGNCLNNSAPSCN